VRTFCDFLEQIAVECFAANTMWKSVEALGTSPIPGLTIDQNGEGNEDQAP